MLSTFRYILFAIPITFGLNNFEEVLAQPANTPNSPKEIYFSIPRRQANPEYLSTFSSIARVSTDSIYGFARPSNLKAFSLSGITLLPHPSAMPVTMAADLVELRQWASYPTLPQYQQLMQAFADSFPTLCTLHTIGQSAEGRAILALRITSSSTEAAFSKPSVFYSSSIHGNEPTGYLLLLRLIDYLCQSYSTNDELTWLVDHTDIWINPLANPDGAYAGGEHTLSGSTRFNANGVDINRNFPDPQAGNHPDNNSWQPETEAMMTFMQAREFTLSANFHTGAEVVNYPWDTWSKRHPFDNWFEDISKKFADTVFAHSAPGYFTDISTTGYTNGYDWYQVNGGRQDYTTWFTHGRELTIELSSDFIPPGADLPVYWESCYRSLIHLIQEAHYGIYGRITDAETHLPVRARVEIIGVDFDQSWGFSRSTDGVYRRPLLPGTYTLKISATGYHTHTTEPLNLQPGQSLSHDIILAALPEGITDSSCQDFSIGSNPSHGVVSIRFCRLPVPGSSCDIYTLSGQLIKQLALADLTNLSTEALELPVKDCPNGVYIVRIKFNDGYKAKRFVLIQILPR